MGTTNVVITLPLDDAVAHDITHLREHLVKATLTLQSDIAATDTTVFFAPETVAKYTPVVGDNLFWPDTRELSVITSVPTDPGGAFGLARGNAGDTQIENFPEAAAAAHTAGQAVSVLASKGLADLGTMDALGIMRQNIQEMGVASETIGVYLAASSQAQQSVQNALNNLITSPATNSGSDSSSPSGS